MENSEGNFLFLLHRNCDLTRARHFRFQQISTTVNLKWIKINQDQNTVFHYFLTLKIVENGDEK